MIVGIILAYLKKTKNTKYNNIVFTGIGAGVLGSIITAILFQNLFGGFTGVAEEIFEGVAMLLGAFFITTVILWMLNQKNVAEHLKNKISKEIKQHDKIGLFFLVFLSVLREGVETVLFLGTASLVGSADLFGSLLGIAAAIYLGYLIFVASIKVDIKKFFNWSSFLLILFAAGLVAHGVHELQEAHVVPIVKEHIWDINPNAPDANQGIYPMMHEDGAIGSIFKGLFGYNGNPNLLEVVAYILYLVLIFGIYKIINKT